MSKKRESKVYFDDRHTDYLIEWSMKSDQVLATELNSLFDEKFKPEDIAAKRVEMKLPPPDREKALAAAIRPSKTQNGSAQKPDDKPLSAAQMMHPSKPRKEQPEIKDKFQDVSEDMRDKIANLLESRRDTNTVAFVPVTVIKVVAGGRYVYPGKGPVECIGESTIPVAGIEMKTVSFREIHALGSSGVHRFDPAKIMERGIRELATPEAIDDIVYRIAKGEGRLKGLPQQGTKQKPFYDDTIASIDLCKLADLICHSFKGDKPLGSRGTLETTYGNAALHLVASEYAVVKGVSYGEAMDLMKHVSSKPTIDQLSRYNDGRMSGGPA